jgi:N-acetylglucosaminyl-diphospho-decaprenol L-rhamnosyltransferase
VASETAPETIDERPRLADLAVVIVSHNDGRWLGACLSSVVAAADGATLELVVVDNDSTDGTRELVESSFPQARVVSSPNLGFAYGNNRGLEHVSARYALLLNPDTEVLEGTLGKLIDLLDERPRVGLVGVRQVTAEGTLWPTIRRFPSVTRALGEALFSAHWPLRPSRSGERVFDDAVYEREGACDWPMGSFMLARREALASTGALDERFFLFCEEPDLCLRVSRAGWEVRHMPQLTIVHHAGKAGVDPRLLAQEAHARRQYAEKHFGRLRAQLYVGALMLHHTLRALLARGASEDARAHREGSKWALRVLAGRAPAPFATAGTLANETPTRHPDSP